MLKHFPALLCLLLMFAVPAWAQDALPDGVLSALAPDLAFLDKGSIESFCFPTEKECIVLLRDAHDELSLFSCALADGQWTRSWGNRYFSLNTAHSASLAVHEEDFITLRTYTMRPSGFALTVTDEAAGTPLETYDFVFIDGNWRLVQHFTGDGMYSEILHSADGDACAVFWADNHWTDIIGKITFPHITSTCADSMSISVLPSVYDGTYFFDLAPRFSMPETGLISVCLGVNNRKYPVYTGPGTTYHRAADGKAAVSSAESFGILGKTGDWLMVIYGISDDRARVGYIRYPGDAYLEQIAALTSESDFSHIENVFTIRKLPLWDDPINRTSPLCTLNKNTEVIYLERCGDLAYVEVKVGGRRMRGFVDWDSLGNG